MNFFNFFRRKKEQGSDNISTMIYNEMNYITSSCVNNNIDITQCAHGVLSVVSENIGMIYLASVFSYLKSYNLQEEKNSLIDNFEIYAKQLYGKNAPHKEALEKIFDIMKLLNGRSKYENEEQRIDSWKIRIREILSKANKKSAGNEVAAFFGIRKLYDEEKMTNELLDHIIKTRDILLSYKEGCKNDL